MSETTAARNKTVPMLLGVVAVLLLAIVVLLVVANNNDTTATTATTDTGTTTTDTGTTSTDQAGMGSSTSAEFDAATATKVPAEQTPEEFVSAYYQAILDKEWETAFAMQPATSQAGQTAADFQSTQEMYGMTSFSIEEAADDGETATVTALQDLGTNGMWAAQWTFVQYEGGWVVQSRAVGMAQ